MLFSRNTIQATGSTDSQEISNFLALFDEAVRGLKYHRINLRDSHSNYECFFSASELIATTSNQKLALERFMSSIWDGYSRLAEVKFTFAVPLRDEIFACRKIGTSARGGGPSLRQPPHVAVFVRACIMRRRLDPSKMKDLPMTLSRGGFWPQDRVGLNTSAVCGCWDLRARHLATIEVVSSTRECCYANCADLMEKCGLNCEKRLVVVMMISITITIER